MMSSSLAKKQMLSDLCHQNQRLCRPHALLPRVAKWKSLFRRGRTPGLECRTSESGTEEKVGGAGSRCKQPPRHGPHTESSSSAQRVILMSLSGPLRLTELSRSLNCFFSIPRPYC